MGVCESQEDATAWAESVDIETIFDHIEADQVWEVEHFIEYAPTQKLSSKSEKRESEPSLLHTAVHWNRASVVADLISAQCAIEITDKFGYSPLHLAVQLDASSADNARFELVEKLIELGANINSLKGTWSPLDTAEDVREESAGANKVIELLLSHGAQNANYSMPFECVNEQPSDSPPEDGGHEPVSSE